MRASMAIAVPVLSSLLLAGTAVTAPAATTTADVQASATKECKKLNQRSKQAKRAGNDAGAKRLKAKYRKCLKRVARDSAREVTDQLAGYTFSGVRGDGASVAMTLCPNGKWASAVTSGGSTGTSEGDTWYVNNLRYSRADKWSTQVTENRDPDDGGWSVGFVRSGSQFQVGIASFDEVSYPGNVTRTAAGQTCATL